MTFPFIIGASQQKRKADSIVWSVRKVIQNYNGFCIKVRRSSDNAIQDIGFDDNVIDKTSLETFIGSNSGYVQVWYDQSGNGHDLEQTDVNIQPYIILNGITILENGLPSIYWNGGQYMISSNNFVCTKISIIVLAKLYGTNQYEARLLCSYPDQYFFLGSSRDNHCVNSFYGIYSGWDTWGDNTSFGWLNKSRLVTAVNNGHSSNNSRIYVDNMEGDTITDEMATFDNKVIVGGMYRNPYPNFSSVITNQCWKGTVSEIQMYSKDILNIRGKIESDILSVFSGIDYKYNFNKNTADDFFNITGIIDTTIINAVNTLISDLIEGNIWRKMVAVYPIVGGTANTHKFNLVDPRDEDAAFRLTFHGTVNHSSTGMIGDGTGYAKTYLIPSSKLTALSLHLSYYSRSDQASLAQREIGAYTASDNQTAMIISFSGSTFYSQISGNSTFSNSITKGLFIVSKIRSKKVSAYVNTTKKINEAGSADNLPTHQIYLMACNNAGTLQQPSKKECAFASIGYGLTESDINVLNSAVQKFQTTLGRNV